MKRSIINIHDHAPFLIKENSNIETGAAPAGASSNPDIIEPDQPGQATGG